MLEGFNSMKESNGQFADINTLSQKELFGISKDIFNPVKLLNAVGPNQKYHNILSFRHNKWDKQFVSNKKDV